MQEVPGSGPGRPMVLCSMIQGVIGAAVKEIFDGVVENLPKPPVGGNLNISMILEVKDGKPVLKEGSEIEISFHAQIGE